ncbi:DUF866-domain-containing protein [Jaminaea rosea]|uniref:DUF866-domain-containing protein n=1 Tax=Jaminaea rosea TaxID=1569628 RepID=A0A316UTI3_9BASI|nr:DUF866-domain-containing protein [Jaminaea rosea]PWN28600.1 DUF866-domain-containing protein [Jaminaea rosea]
MPLFALEIRAQLENVTALRPASDDYTLMVRTKCNSCHEEHPKLVGITPGSEIEMKGGRGTADFVMSCSFCKRESSATFPQPTSKAPLWRPYSPSPDSGPVWAPICTLDVRGMDIIGFEPEGIWSCQGTGEGSKLSKFDEVEFDGGEWTDYDEKSGEPVSIMELEGRWVRA